jgi:hypothetical protein
MNRIRLLALIGLLFTAGPVAAQSPAIGFKLGATFSTLDVADDDGDTENSLSAFGGGGFIRFGLSGIGIEIDVLALTKGSEVDGLGDEDTEIKLDYVEVPVQAVFSLGSGRFSPYIMAGPSFAFEIGCKVDDETVTESIECDNADFFERKSVDIGLTGAAGLQIPLGPGNLLVEGRYTHGLSNIYDNESQVIQNEVKNRSWGIFGGYSIPIGSR